MSNTIKLSYNEKPKSSYVSPIFKANSSYLWVPYSNAKGDYSNIDKFPDELLYYKNNCAWHSRVLKFIINQVAGKGFISDDPKTIAFLKEVNNLGEDGNEVLEKNAFDEATFGGITFTVTWSKNWKTFGNLKQIPVDKIRCGKVNLDGEIDTYYYSYDWSDSQMPKQPIPAFNKGIAKTKATAFNDALSGNDYDVIRAMNIESHTQLIYFKPYSSSNFYYPLPDYIASLSSIRGDINSDIYSEIALQNGMSKTTHINLVGNMSKEQFAEEANAILDNYTGASNTGKPFITKSQTKEKAPIVGIAGDDSKEDRFKTVTDVTRQKIFTAHGLTSPLLAGVALPGALGNRDEMLDAYELFYTNVIQPKQMFITKAWNKILKQLNLGPVQIERLTLFESLNKDNDNEIKKEDGTDDTNDDNSPDKAE